MQTNYIGADIGKENIDIFVTNKHFVIKNKTQAIINFFKTIDKSNEKYFVVCEPTGGYEEALIKSLRNLKIPVKAEHSNKVRAFAKSVGKLAKSDKIDAKILSDYGRIMQPVEAEFIKTEAEADLLDLLKRRDELLKQKQMEKNRLEKSHFKTVESSIRKHIKWLEKELEKIDKEILEYRNNTKEIKSKCYLFTSVPGVGDIVATNLVAYLPELGKLDHQKIASLVGVAPFHYESGSYKGKRSIYGGRAYLRKMLYMSAVASLKWNKEMKNFYSRLAAKGKPPKVALVAVMRKLIVLLNTIAARQTPWTEKSLMV